MERNNRLLAVTLSLILISGLVTPGFLNPAYASTEILYMVSKGPDSASPSQLWVLDKTTGIATPLASPVGFEACTSMDFIFGHLFAACEEVADEFGAGFENGLVAIDHLTGIGTAVGPNEAAPPGFLNYGGMSTQPTTGILFAYQSLGFSTGIGLGTMSDFSGLFSPIDAGPGLNGGNGLAFSPVGLLYVARADGGGPDTINQVNLANGDEIASAVIGYNAPLADDDKTTAMDFSAGGTLWAAIKLAAGGPTASSYLATINPVTGAMNTPVLIQMADTSPIVGVDGLAFLSDGFEECFVHAEWFGPDFGPLDTPIIPNMFETDDDCVGSTGFHGVLPRMTCTDDTEVANSFLCEVNLPNFIDDFERKLIFIDIIFAPGGPNTLPSDAPDPVVTAFDTPNPSECVLTAAELDSPTLFIYDFECIENPDWETIYFSFFDNVQVIQIWTTSFNDPEVGGTFIPIDQSALLLAGVQSISMWMIPVVIAGIGIGIFVIKRRN